MSSGGNSPAVGQQTPVDGNTRFNSSTFLVRQRLARARSMMLVKIITIYSTDELAEVGFVDVQPMVNQLDGAGNSQSHGTIFGVPYTRIQGGTNAIIIDPKVNDKGWMVISDRDISVVKKTKAVGNPGSYRKNSPADGVYIGGILNGIPEQYIQFLTDGMKFVDKNGNVIVMNADGITINGVLFARDQKISNVQDIDGTGEVTFDGHTLTEHKHGGGTIGSGETDTPTG